MPIIPISVRLLKNIFGVGLYLYGDFNKTTSTSGVVITGECKICKYKAPFKELGPTPNIGFLIKKILIECYKRT